MAVILSAAKDLLFTPARTFTREESSKKHLAFR
jgi:hypothetical protein